MKAALLGLGDDGKILHQALLSEPTVELIAVADRDRELAVRLGEQTGAAAYNDYRLAVVESTTKGLETLFVALPPYETDDCLRMAARAQVATLMLPPLARSFDVARELAGLFAKAGRPLVVARTWQFEPAYLRLHDLASLAGHVFAARAEVTCPAIEPQDWRADARRAGGGVLLHGGYEVVDALVTLLGVPAGVYATLGFATPTGQARSYDTEDAASIVCRYADDRTAAVTCRRGGSAPTWSIALAGANASVKVTPETMTVTDIDGAPVSQTAVRTSNRFSPAVNVFATSLAAGVSRVPGDAGEHLATLATISAAYLSARTGQHESPGKFLELSGVGDR